MRSQILALLISFAVGCAAAPGEPALGDGEPAVAPAASATPLRPTLVRVVDPAGRPVPCATLSSWGEGAYSYVTDASGTVAIYEPDLMGNAMTFAISHPAPGVFTAPFAIDINLPTAPVVVTSPGALPTSFSCTPPIDHGAFLTATGTLPAPGQMFTLLVLDGKTKRALPGAQVIMPHRTYVTDSSGAAAIYETGVMNSHATVTLAADGYVTATGVSVDLTPGLTRQVTIDPDASQIAVRLYRINGPGIFRDRVLLGQSSSQGLNADMISQDGPMTALYQGRVYWTFGDTNHESAGHSNYRGSAASSAIPVDAERWFPLGYVHQIDGREAAIAPVSEFDNDGALAWPGGLASVPDARGTERLYSTFRIMNGKTGFDTLALGLGRYNDTTHVFERKLWFDLARPTQPGAHAFKVNDGAQSFLYYENLTRIPASEGGLLHPESYEAFTPLQPDGTAEHDDTGRIRYRWRTQTAELGSDNVAGSGASNGERLFGQLRDARLEPGAPHRVPIKASARDYNPFRKRYVEVITEDQPNFVPLDATWYAEADTPMGPWVYARRITGAGSRSIYNPTIAPFRNNDAQILFAAVYAAPFIPAPPLPYYNYSVVMHMLDVNDLRTALPVPVYELSAADNASFRLGTKAAVHPGMPAELPAPFFAYDRPAAGTVPAYLVGASCRPDHGLLVGAQPALPQRYEPDFYVLPGDVRNGPDDSVALYEYSLGFYPPYHVYAVDGAPEPGGFTKNPRPVARVFGNPMSRVWFPVTGYLPDLVASAGDDLCASEAAPGAGADIILDASASRSLAGAITSYAWNWATSSSVHGPASGARTTVHLPAGSHIVQLSITTADGHTATDKVVVDIAAAH
jgi:hypothetical protein